MACTEPADVATKDNAVAGNSQVGQNQAGNSSVVSSGGAISNPGSSSNMAGGGNSGAGIGASSPTTMTSATPTAGGSVGAGATASGGGLQVGGTMATGGSQSQGVGGDPMAAGGTLATGSRSSNLAGRSSTGGAPTTTGTAPVAGSPAAGSGNIPYEIMRSQLPFASTSEVSDPEYSSFISGINEFGLDLQQRMNADAGLTTKNGVFSPTSVQLALAMTYGGAVGDTAAAMKTVLRDNLGGSKYHSACNRLIRDLASRNASRNDGHGYTYRIELAPTNAVWAERTVTIKTTYLDLLGTQYDAGVPLVDFIRQPDPSRRAINDWVAANTHDKIKDLLSPSNVTTDTRFVLVNALYLYASWDRTFQKQATASAAFHTLAGADVNVDTMHDTTNMNYYAAANAAVLQRNYTTGNLKITFVLPNAGEFETVRSQVSAAWLGELTNNLKSTYVKLALPKFKIQTAQMALGSSLKAQGMSTAFGSDADFTGIAASPKLFISDVVQKAFIGLDEDGTEAAAATAVLMETVSIQPTPIEVTIDRPFLFFIQDKTGLVLFSGQVVDPTQ